MCGIAGLVSFNESQVSEGSLNAMVDCLEHRGPDDHGSYIDRNIGLGHTRLSIIDLSSAGRQPMHSKCGRYTLVYNGEIYNAAELKDGLGGIELRGHSDTEVLLESLIRYGPDIISRLNGMFAFAFYDKGERTLLLSRDRFGIKPLFIAEEHGTLRFGSEIKCLFAGGLSNRKLRKSAVHEFLYYGVTLGAQTLFESVDRLLPGSVLRVRIDSGHREIWSFHKFPKAIEQTISSDPESRVLELLDASVRRHLISDVPVAIFLSGGIDSSTITAFATKHSAEQLISYSVGFDIPGGVDELPIARLVANRYGTDHRELHVTVDGVKDVLEKLSDAHDVPFGDAANIPLYLLCEQLSGEVKVVLQGDGGDEIFGGYARYRWLLKAKILRSAAAVKNFIPLDLLPANFAMRVNRILEAFSNDDSRLMALLLTEECVDPPPTRVLSDSWQNEIAKYDPFLRYAEVNDQLEAQSVAQRMLHIDAQIILPDVFLEKVDRSTMAHSIEVRVPFLDTDLTDYMLRLPAESKLPGGRQKGLLKSALRNVLPDEVLNRKKTGFSVPYKEWMRGSLGDWLLQLLDERSVRESGLFSATKIREILSTHRQGKYRDGFLLYKVLVMALWIHRARVTV